MLAIKRWSAVPGEADAPCSRHCPDRVRRFPLHTQSRSSRAGSVARTVRRSRHRDPAGSGTGPAGPPPSPRGAPPPPAERCQATGRCFSDRNGKSAAGVGGREMAGLGLPAGARGAPPASAAPKKSGEEKQPLQLCSAKIAEDPRAGPRTALGTGTPSLAGGGGRDRVSPSRDSPGALLPVVPFWEHWPCRTSPVRLNP